MKSRIDKLEYTFEILFYNKYYYKNNKSHRDKDLPAVIREDGSKFWFKNGLNHRNNSKPCGIYSDGEMFWYENGIFIRSNLNEIKNK